MVKPLRPVDLRTTEGELKAIKGRLLQLVGGHMPARGREAEKLVGKA